MPKMIVCAIYDVKATAYSPPLCFNTVGLAQRFLADECTNPDSNIARHPEDYDLRQIGLYDTDTGEIASMAAPSVISKATDHVHKA